MFDYRYVLHEIHLYSWLLAWRRLLDEQLVDWDGEMQIPVPKGLGAGRLQAGGEMSAEGLKDPRPKPLRPDATATVARRGGRGAHLFLIEYDRTRRVDKNFEKFRRYDTFVNWWWRFSELRDRDRAPWVLFVCQDEADCV